MKLYYHPVSTTSRPVVLFAAESKIDLDYQIVDLFNGEQYQPEYAAINPSRQVPVPSSPRTPRRRRAAARALPRSWH